MRISDMFQVVDMLYNEWDLGKKASMAKGKICAWIYLMDVLEETEVMVIRRHKNRLIGLCGYAKYNSNKHKIKKKFYHIIKRILLISQTIKNKTAIYKYMQGYDYTPKELEKYFDGEISLLIVDKKYRRKGIGKQLLLQTFENAKKDKMKRLQILTDESCNFEFYELCGCKKVYETTIQYGECDKDNEMGYIYEKVI